MARYRREEDELLKVIETAIGDELSAAIVLEELDDIQRKAEEIVKTDAGTRRDQQLMELGKSIWDMSVGGHMYGDEFHSVIRPLRTQEDVAALMQTLRTAIKEYYLDL